MEGDNDLGLKAQGGREGRSEGGGGCRWGSESGTQGRAQQVLATGTTGGPPCAPLELPLHSCWMGITAGLPLSALPLCSGSDLPCSTKDSPPSFGTFEVQGK